MYDAEYTRSFYDAYAEAEWERLQAKPYGRLQAIVHEDFVKRYVNSGDNVLDAGSGPGRFSIAAAKLGARVTLLDISEKQLEIAQQKIGEDGQMDKVESFIRGDICDLSMFAENQFDTIICFGGTLSYVCEKREMAAAEITRVTRSGGIILVSVMTQLGGLLHMIHQPEMESGNIWSIVNSGDLPGFLSSQTDTSHPPMHLFTANELSSLFNLCQIEEIAGSNVTIMETDPRIEEKASDPSAWSALVEREHKINHEPGLVNSGSHIILAARKL